MSEPTREMTAEETRDRLLALLREHLGADAHREAAAMIFELVRRVRAEERKAIAIQILEAREPGKREAQLERLAEVVQFGTDDSGYRGVGAGRIVR